MIKHLIIVLAAAALTPRAITAQRGAELVPQHHWAYTSCDMLVKAGVIASYRPSICYPTRQGHADDRCRQLLTRYEFAVVTNRANAHLPEWLRHARADTRVHRKRIGSVMHAVVQLKKEFRPEINEIGTAARKGSG